MNDYILILYGIICIVLFIIWYNMSNKIIINKFNQYCKENKPLNTNIILWDIISRFMIFVVIGYIILYIFNNYIIGK